MNISFVLFALLLFNFFKLSKSWEYCKPKIKMCKDDIVHTVCNPTNAFKKVDYSSEVFVGHVPMTRKVQKILIEEHNKYRNLVASGESTNKANNEEASDKNKFPAASRMRELIWDNELMYIAHKYVQQVKMGHDKCRSTQRFPYSGQNLGFKPTKIYLPIIDVITDLLKDMFAEKNKVENAIEFPKKWLLKEYKDAGHFATLMADRISRLGCAVAVAHNCSKLNASGDVVKKYDICYYFGCNYDFTNLENRYIYKTGKGVRSECSDFGVGNSEKYEYLCANSGELLPKWLSGEH